METIKQVVANWAELEPIVLRAYIYGSWVRGEQSDKSDLDVAIELQCLPNDGNELATWIGEKKRLQQSLQELLPITLHLEWYGGAAITPRIHSGLKSSSIMVYENQ